MLVYFIPLPEACYKTFLDHSPNVLQLSPNEAEIKVQYVSDPAQQHPFPLMWDSRVFSKVRTLQLVTTLLHLHYKEILLALADFTGIQISCQLAK